MIPKFVSVLLVTALTACDADRAAQQNLARNLDRLPPLPRESMTDAQKNAWARFAESIANGRRPYGTDEEEDAAYKLVFEILQNKRVSDLSWKRAVQAFGEAGVVDLLGITGYYSFLAVVLNAARMPPPASGPLLSRFPN